MTIDNNTQPENQPDTNTNAPATLHAIALAALAALADADSTDDRPELRFLRTFGTMFSPTEWPIGAQAALNAPTGDDAALVRIAGILHLSPIEVLTLALTAAVEENAMVGRAVAYLQSPPAPRPTVGLCAHAFAGVVPPEQSPLYALTAGSAIASGFLSKSDTDAPLPDQTLAMRLPIVLALRGYDVPCPGTTLGLGAFPSIPLPVSVLARAHSHAMTLASMPHGALAIRNGSSAEARNVANAIAIAMGKRPLFIENDRHDVPMPLILLRDLLPVVCLDLAPGDRKSVPSWPFYDGPVIVMAGLEGTIDRPGGLLSFVLPIPERAERQMLWELALADSPLPEELAATHRQRPGRIAEIGRLAHQQAAIDGRDSPTREDVVAASRSSEGGLGALAQSMAHRIDDNAFIMNAELRHELNTLVLRCRARDDLVDSLGPSARARYHSGIRALFAGPSGTGKTLAAAWMATELGLPLYRVDLASVTSKYIGETEKNLAQLFARAEDTEVVLLFDEADSLFGKRTDVRDANDRFANAQTNYLLQRMESFDGIAILTSNAKSRLDSAFARRLDAIIDFPLPGTEERRALWLAHLGNNHQIAPRDINRLAAALDVAGGHIRNVVLMAAVLAHACTRPISFADVLEALASECKKLGRPVPTDLRHV